MNNLNETYSRKHIAFIGFGLIGGSIAKALRKANQDISIYAYNHLNSPNEELELARSDKVIDKIYISLEELVPKCDLIFLCTPVLTNISYLSKIKPYLNSNCIITDVGSVKGNIHNSVKELDLENNFIGGHPMTGSEKTGYKNSYDLLLENAYYILTPTRETPREMVDSLYSLIKDIGSIPIILDAKDHDEITAAISHVPHIIAAQLVNLVANSGDKADKMKALAAGGFKDITRIASSSPIIWQNICLTNGNEIKKILNLYIDSLTKVSDAISEEDRDSLYSIFDKARDFRDGIPNEGNGLIAKTHEIFLDIIDEAGAIATIASLLADSHISIKNIGIIHNREFQEGVLRVEFYDEAAVISATALLKESNYKVYER